MFLDATFKGGLGVDKRLARLRELRGRLAREVRRPLAWSGPLRRAQLETASYSTSIEGYHVGESRLLAISEGAAPDPNDDGELALAAYALAMDHVIALADDPHFVWQPRVILDLHFEVCSFQKDKRPGRLRQGPIAVTGTNGHALAYRGPSPSQAMSAVQSLCAFLEKAEKKGEGTAADDPYVVAALAHLELVSIHPFEDGNGRISRILQSLVLARDGVLSPEFGSIERVLAEDTGTYYAQLQNVQNGQWSDGAPYPRAWIDFCVDAHIRQLEDRIAVHRQAAERWSALERLVAERGWGSRLVIALERAIGGHGDRQGYGEEAGVSPATASADLRRLVDAGLLVRSGNGPSTVYLPSDTLKQHLA